MDTVKLLLALHVAAGSVALLAAFAAISLKKGSPKHNLVGRVYFWAMMAVALTAIPVSIARPNLMLFFVALSRHTWHMQVGASGETAATS